MKTEDLLVDAITDRIESQFLLAAQDAADHSTGWVRIHITDGGTIAIDHIPWNQVYQHLPEDAS